MLAGARPGDVFADFVFNWCFRRVMREVEAELVAAHVLCPEPRRADGIFGGWVRDEAVDATCCSGVAWVDDDAIPISADTPDSLLDSLALAAQVVQAVAARRGLTVNFKKGKTEAVVHLRGQGAVEARQRLVYDGPEASLLPLLRPLRRNCQTKDGSATWGNRGLRRPAHVPPTPQQTLTHSC